MEIVQPAETLSLDTPRPLSTGSVIMLEDYVTGAKGEVRIGELISHTRPTDIFDRVKDRYEYALESMPNETVIVVR